MHKSFFRLDAFLHVEVQASSQKVGEVVQFSRGRSALGDAPCGVMNPCFEIAWNLLLLLDLPDRRLLTLAK